MLLTRETIFQCTHRGGEESLIQSNKYTVTRITFEKKINKFPYASSNTSVDINRIVRFAIRGIPRTTNPPVFRTKTSNPSRSTWNLVPPLSKKRLKRGEIAALDSNRGGSFGKSCTNNGLTERVNERRRGEQRVERRRTSAMETGLRE